MKSMFRIMIMFLGILLGVFHLAFASEIVASTARCPVVFEGGKIARGIHFEPWGVYLVAQDTSGVLRPPHFHDIVPTWIAIAGRWTLTHKETESRIGYRGLKVTHRMPGKSPSSLGARKSHPWDWNLLDVRALKEAGCAGIGMLGRADQERIVSAEFNGISAQFIPTLLVKIGKKLARVKLPLATVLTF